MKGEPIAVSEGWLLDDNLSFLSPAPRARSPRPRPPSSSENTPEAEPNNIPLKEGCHESSCKQTIIPPISSTIWARIKTSPSWKSQTASLVSQKRPAHVFKSNSNPSRLKGVDGSLSFARDIINWVVLNNGFMLIRRHSERARKNGKTHPFLERLSLASQVSFKKINCAIKMYLDLKF